MIASLIGGPGLTAVLLAGWGLQALTWALARVRDAAARRGEWLPEFAVRGAVLTLVVASLVTPGGHRPRWDGSRARLDKTGTPQEGYQRLHDLGRLCLNANLAVLSGCETALGRTVEGEG